MERLFTVELTLAQMLEIYAYLEVGQRLGHKANKEIIKALKEAKTKD